jgi:hypothetical protein
VKIFPDSFRYVDHSIWFQVNESNFFFEDFRIYNGKKVKKACTHKKNNKSDKKNALRLQKIYENWTSSAISVRMKIAKKVKTLQRNYDLHDKNGLQ